MILDFFPEPAVRELLKDLLDPSLPICGSDGFVEVGGIRYGTIFALARLIGISRGTVQSRIDELALAPAKGRANGGQLVNLFPEPVVRGLFGNLLELPLPVCGSDGFVDFKGIRHGTVNYLANLLGVSGNAIRSRIASLRLVPMRGRLKEGNFVDLWSEPTVREACANILDPSLPVCGSDGLVEIDGVRHGTVRSLARLLGVSNDSISSRLASSGVVPVRGKDQRGHSANIFPEPAVREACKELLERKKK